MDPMRSRGSLALLAAVVALGSILAGDARPGGASPEEAGTRVLRVRVVEEDRRDHGVPKARVDAWRIERVPPGEGMPPSDCLSDSRGETDADGWTTIRRVTRRAAYLQIRASGFTMGRRIIPAAPEEVTRVEIALARGTVVAGKVRRADGSAAEGVRVRGTQPEQWGWVGDSHEAVTDSFGTFRLSGIYPGLVSLDATLDDGDAVWVGASTVEAGRVDGEIRLPAEPSRRRIRLLVTGADGRPVAWALWHAADGLWPPQHWKPSGRGVIAKGEGVVPADPDVQWISIASPRDDAHGHALPWTTTIVGPLGRRGGDLQVVMPRGHTVSGTVRDVKGNALHGIRVFAKPLSGEGGTECTVPANGWLDSVTDWEGRFQLEGVPAGRVEVVPFDHEWRALPARVSVPTGPLDFVMRPQRKLRVCVHHPDGSPAPEAVLYARGQDVEVEGWSRVLGDRDGNFTVYFYPPCVIRLRTGLSPSGVEDMAASEVTTEPGEDAAPVVLKVPLGRSLLVHVPEWPASMPGAVRLTNGPHSPGSARWIMGGTARFERIDPRLPVSIYCGPLPDGRIAFARDIVAKGDEVTVPLVPSRSIRGHARGFPSDAKPVSAWADDSTFEAPGHMGPDGRFLIRGVPVGACRVCVVFARGEELWAGSVRDGGSGDPVEVEVKRLDEADLEAWVYPRPAP